MTESSKYSSFTESPCSGLFLLFLSAELGVNSSVGCQLYYAMEDSNVHMWVKMVQDPAKPKFHLFDWKYRLNGSTLNWITSTAIEVSSHRSSEEDEQDTNTKRLATAFRLAWKRFNSHVGDIERILLHLWEGFNNAGLAHFRFGSFYFEDWLQCFSWWRLGSKMYIPLSAVVYIRIYCSPYRIKKLAKACGHIECRRFLTGVCEAIKANLR